VDNWVGLFNKHGIVSRAARPKTRSRWPEEVLVFIRAYRDENPCFFLDELQQALQTQFPNLSNFSVSTICRDLRHDMLWSRKVIEKRAREARSDLIHEYPPEAGEVLPVSCPAHLHR
jgi:hypothetical protein